MKLSNKLLSHIFRCTDDPDGGRYQEEAAEKRQQKMDLKERQHQTGDKPSGTGLKKADDRGE